MSIGRKFTLWIILILLIVIVVSMPLFISFELKEEQGKLEILSRTTGYLVEESLLSYMHQRDSGRLDKKLVDIRNSSTAIGNIQLLDRNGTVKNSTDRSAGQKWEHLLEQAGNNSGPRQRLIKADNETYRWIHPVVNKPACQGCHNRQTGYNGTIVIDFPAREIERHLRKELFGAAGILLTTIILTGAVMLVLWNLLVRKRLNSVIGKVKMIQSGIYHAVPAGKGSDEFTRLETDFNSMAEAVQAREGEKQNLVTQLSQTNADLLKEIGMRKQWERMLQEQKRFSDALIQNSAVATFVLDRDRRVVIWNKACETMTGIPAEAMVGTDSHWKPFYSSKRQTLADLVLDCTSDLSALYQKNSPSTLVADGLHAEGWYRNLNGKDRYIIFDAAPIVDSRGELTAAIETLQDVTEQKNIEAALGRSEAKFRTIIDTQPECVKLVGADGIILEINKAGLSMLEADSPDEIIGQSMMKFVVPEHAPAVQIHFESILNGESRPVEYEITGLKNSRRWVDSRAALLRNEHGDVSAVLAVTRDVTGRKLSERMLQEQLHFMQTLMDTIPMPVFYKDMQGKYQGCNKAFEDYLGMPKESLLGKSVYDIAPKELADEYYNRDRELFEKPGVQVYEFSVKHADASVREVIFNKATYADAKGNVAGLIGVILDITNRKRAEEKLRHTNHTLETLISASPIAIQVLDPDGRIVLWNPAAERLIGWMARDVVGYVNPIVPEDNQEEFKTLRDRVLRGDAFTGFEVRRQKKDGSTVDLSLSTAPLRDASGRVSGILALLTDITERKRMEEKLQQTNETLQTLIQASPLAVVSFDAKGIVGVWNPAAARIFGWSEQEVQGRFNPIIPEEQKQEFLELLSRVLQGESLMGVELRRQRKDGSLIGVSVSSAPIRNTKNEITGIMSVIEDITERNRAAEEIRRQYDTQTAINWILHISLENMPIENIMKQALDLILSIPWLSFESRGAIFLVEEEPDILILKAERGLSGHLKEKCKSVPFGTCLCGRAAARGDVQFADSIDARHEVQYDGIAPHGHYCVPIKHARAVLGVITIYLRHGHVLNDKEVEFLNAIANSLAGVIRRSKAEAALHESEKRYRTLAEAAHDVIFIVDREGRIDYVNSYGAAVFGRSSQELTGKSLAELFPSDITERQRSNLSKVFESGESLYVENPFSFSGRETWLSTWLVPLKDAEGKVGSVLGVARDITEKIRSEQEREVLIRDLQNTFSMVSRSHKEWQDTFDSITDMITIIDKDFTIVKANKAFARYFGLHPRDVINTKCHTFYHESDSPIAGCPHQKTMADKQAFSAEVTDKRTNKVIRITTFPYLSPDGNMMGSIHVSRDITEEKEREMRLIMTERLAALGQMASGIAHEINNPLASIAGCSEGLLSRIKKGQCDYQLFETYLNIIQEEIFRCKSITTAMLSFVRKTTYEKKAVQISEMLDRTVEIISFQGRLKDVKIVRNYTADAPAVQANEGELRQVCLAIVANALDAMNDEGTLTLETGLSGNSAFIRIGDTGPGIPEENLATIFDPFYTTKAERGGTGLGLSIARKIIHNHNGTIEVSSEPDKGSVFTIKLPL